MNWHSIIIAAFSLLGGAGLSWLIKWRHDRPKPTVRFIEYEGEVTSRIRIENNGQRPIRIDEVGLLLPVWRVDRERFWRLSAFKEPAVFPAQQQEDYTVSYTVEDWVHVCLNVTREPWPLGCPDGFNYGDNAVAYAKTSAGRYIFSHSLTRRAFRLGWLGFFWRCLRPLVRGKVKT